MSAAATDLCRVTAVDQGDGTYGLRFELRNDDEQPVQLSTYEPFTAFSLLARDAEGPAQVHQPPLDIPVNAITIDIPAGGTTVITSPVRIKIGSGLDAGTDGLVWTIPHDAATVELGVRVDLPAPYDVLVPLQLPGTDPS